MKFQVFNQSLVICLIDFLHHRYMFLCIFPSSMFFPNHLARWFRCFQAQLFQCLWFYNSATSSWLYCHYAKSNIHSVHFNGDVRISSELILQDVLYVPQFQFNLLFVSALTTSSQLTFTFFTDHFIIQEIHNMSMIGKGNKLRDLYILDVKSTNLDPSAFGQTIGIPWSFQ